MSTSGPLRQTVTAAGTVAALVLAHLSQHNEWNLKRNYKGAREHSSATAATEKKKSSAHP